MKKFLHIFAFLLFISTAFPSLASEQETTTGKMRFFPLAPRTASQNYQPKPLAKEIKFYPLPVKTPRTFALASKTARTIANHNIPVPELLPEKPESKTTGDKKAQMSSEQAKQILSLFAENR